MCNYLLLLKRMSRDKELNTNLSRLSSSCS